MEQSLATTDPERFDLRGVVSECVNGYRMAHFPAAISSPVRRVIRCVSGAPDLAAQLLDKLVDNAGDFALPDTPIRVDLAFDGPIGGAGGVQSGPQLPAELEGRLFESMVSGRGGGGDQPTLASGLYVARMIARFHGGELSAENLRDGVRFSATFSLVLRSLATSA